jgi:molybdenum cofactor synthesis domain-containing protein
LIPYAEAKAFVLDAVAALPPVASPLEAAWGCVAAEEVVAREQIPGFVNSSMDGYALRAADTVLGPTRLRVVAATLAGDPVTARIGAGEAARVMTGAPLPEGADCVCMVEETRLDPGGNLVEIGRTMAAGENVRHPGEDVRVGDVLVRPGEELDAVRVGVVASQGFASVVVHPRPRVGVLSTGNELVGGGETLRRGAIRDTNRPMVLALLRESGFEPVDLGSVRDDYGATCDRLADGVARCDAVVSTGGVSMGDVDHVKSAILELGAGRARWMQVAIRPGKPFAFGVVGDRAAPVFGLPGNPVSTRVSFELFVRPALRRLAGQRVLDRPVFRAVLDEPLGRERDGKLRLVHMTARLDGSAVLRVGRVARHGSHLLNAIAGSNAIALVPDGDGLGAGDVVSVMILDTAELVPPTS